MIIIYCLYKEEIPFYIGKTKNPKAREYAHKYKYGHSVYLDILDEVSEVDWKFWEGFYIQLFKSWDFKLENKNKEGGGTLTHTEQSKNKISNANKGKIRTSEQKLKCTGPRPNSSITKTGKPHPKIRKPINQYDLNGNIIKEWSCAREAILITKFKSINNVLRQINHAKTAGGYIWKYKQ